MSNIILASSSIYRQQLLRRLQLEFESITPDIDETPQIDESPEALVNRLAVSKAQSVAKTYTQHLIIGSDQVAELDGQILGKPGEFQAGFRQLRAQSGRRVRFFTAVCVLASGSGDYQTDTDVCDVYFRNLSDQQINDYLNREKPFDCAGSFKSEFMGIALVEKISSDDPTGLIGLPIIKLVKLLENFGLTVI